MKTKEVEKRQHELARNVYKILIKKLLRTETWNIGDVLLLFSLALQPSAGYGLLVHEVS
jgi:hypothetical protein